MSFINLKVCDVNTDRERQGIHLLNPTEREIDDACTVAERDGFKSIYIHIKTELLESRSKYQRFKTWCKSKDLGYRAFLDLVLDRYPEGTAVDLSHVGFSPVAGGGWGVFEAGTTGKVIHSGGDLVLDVDGYVYKVDLINKPCGRDNLACLEFNKYSAIAAKRSA